VAELELLNIVSHARLTMRQASSADRHFVQIVPGEFARVAARCPIVLTKHPETGGFYAGALFGFAPGENLLADEQGAFDGYLPFDLVREGFFVTGDDIAIDGSVSRFTRGEGAPLFDEDGNPSDDLRRVQHALGAMKTGLEESEQLLKVLLDLSLVEPIDIALSFDDGERLRLDGLYTVSRDALSELDDADVLRLFRSGMLQHAYTIAGSLAQVALLAQRRNDRLIA
jgi:hypothetical protein